jgi:ferritin-like metal-binding protein YciE
MAKMSKAKQQEKQLDELFHEALKDIYYAEKRFWRRCRKWPRPRTLTS